LRRHRQNFPAAIATTPRLLDCTSEANFPAEDCIERVFTFDSWLAAASRVKAAWKLLKVKCDAQGI
jgi:hypothetical protein